MWDEQRVFPPSNIRGVFSFNIRMSYLSNYFAEQFPKNVYFDPNLKYTYEIMLTSSKSGLRELYFRGKIDR